MTEAEEIMKVWNEIAEAKGWEPCRIMNAKRKSWVRARLADDGDYLERFKEVLESLDDDFYSGSNDRGWVANIEWALRPNTIYRILEKRSVKKKGDRLAKW